MKAVNAAATRQTMHCPPTREYVIEAVREMGARAVYGADWPHSDAKTLELLLAYPYKHMVAKDCDHHDAEGRCLGHDA